MGFFLKLMAELYLTLRYADEDRLFIFYFSFCGTASALVDEPLETLGLTPVTDL